MLHAVNLEKSYDALGVLRRVSLTVEKGEVVAIIGRSGSGKSTLLRCLNHLEKVDAGIICVDGDVMVDTENGGYAPREKLHTICLKMGYVFQNFNLFPHFTVLRNLTEAQRCVLKRPKEEAAARAEALLQKVGLSDKRDQYPFQLSGGQQQRVAIARALALDPKILCFDEPTSALDPEMVDEVLSVIASLKGALTMMIVTHEMAFAGDAADRVVFMDDGLLVEDAPPAQLFKDPQNARTRAFLARTMRGLNF